MKTHIKHLVSIASVTVLLAGCASAPSHFYTLNSTAKADGSPEAQYAVAVGPVSIPAEVDRPQLTVQSGQNRVEIEEFNRWAAPLRENIARAVAGDLAILLGTPRVTGVPLANFNPDYRVTIDIQQFESVRDQTTGNATAVIEAIWVVRPTKEGAARSGRTVARESATGDSFEALAAAHSRALAKVSSAIAAAIRAEAEEKP